MKKENEVSLPQKEQVKNNQEFIEMIECFKEDLDLILNRYKSGKCDRKNCLKNLYGIGKDLQSEFNITYNSWMDK
tara:strand:+ start:446 stop:670 length:225 start_codon:yes stop_codon:yes gene_type:complete